jgi:hypothetical protein
MKQYLKMKLKTMLPPAPPSGYGTLKQGLHEEAVLRKMAPGRDQRRNRRPLLPRRHQSIWQDPPSSKSQ